MKTETNDKARMELDAEIDKRSKLMWQAIVNLPKTVFDIVFDSLRAVQDVGKQAADIILLRQAASLL